MAAKRAPRSRANLASAAALRWAVTASIRYSSASWRSRSIVLEPIEPVAPNSVTERGTGCATGAKSTRGNPTPAAISSASSTLPYQQAACRCSNPMVNRADDEGSQSGEDESIEPIHQPSMPGDEMTGVLGAEAPLDGGFQRGRRLAPGPTTHTPCPRRSPGCRPRSHRRRRRWPQPPRQDAAGGAGPGLVRADPRP